ncbi:MAG: HAMP domain-containing sensor histidine kinase [Lautropia sp.]|nr:HAMP domain-containing sensor histidine kinase [Lautropia sp.]
MRRLSVTIFLSLLASLVLVGVAVTIAWQWSLAQRTEAQANRFAEALAAEVIPLATEGHERLSRVLHHWHRRLNVDFQVLDAEGRLVAAAGRPFELDVPPGVQRKVDEAPDDRAGDERDAHRARWRVGRQGGPMVAVIHRLALPDARTLVIRSWRPKPPGPPVSLPVLLALLFVAVGLAAWPVSRRITRRLETLKHSVDQQAAGQLSVRADVQGRDEVAALAQSFNRAAERIEGLVSRQEALLSSQRQLLANASHELRSPLARIRMATELMLASPAELEAHAEELRLNIRELDELVEEILLASRLESQTAADLQRAPVDVRAWVAEASAPVGAVWQVADEVPAVVYADPRLLRRLLRNLLDNARRYHPPEGEPIEVRLSMQRPDCLHLVVLDRGRGVPEAARARIFEPFYRVSGHSESAGGVGLGLSLVRQIALQHGGEVVYEAREGGGSCFVVTLPCPA